MYEVKAYGSRNPFPSLRGIPCWKCRQEEARCSWRISVLGGNLIPLCVECEILLQYNILDYIGGIPEDIFQKAMKLYREQWERDLNADS